MQNLKSRKARRLHKKRNNKITTYLHQSSRIIINQLVSRNVHTLIIGKCDGWKQEMNLGTRNNQNFFYIPHEKFIDMLVYKAQLEGISVIIHNEAYTSKCSFLDNESIEYHDKYAGQRIKRGLFRSALKKLINADVNGSLNIMRKAVGEKAFPMKDGKPDYSIEVCSTPAVVTPSK